VTGRLSHNTGKQHTPHQRLDKETEKDRKGKEQGKLRTSGLTGSSPLTRHKAKSF